MMFLEVAPVGTEAALDNERLTPPMATPTGLAGSQLLIFVCHDASVSS